MDTTTSQWFMNEVLSRGGLGFCFHRRNNDIVLLLFQQYMRGMGMSMSRQTILKVGTLSPGTCEALLHSQNTDKRNGHFRDDESADGTMTGDESAT